MKLGKFMAAAVIMLMTASTGILRGEPQNNYSAKTNGQAAGSLLKKFQKQYKADGKIDLANLDNVIQLTALGNVIYGLKGQDDNSEYFNDFSMGLVSGSKKLINTNSASNITKLLRSLADIDFTSISKATEAALNSAIPEMYSTGQNGEKKAAEAISSLSSDRNAIAAASAVSSILDLLGK